MMSKRLVDNTLRALGAGCLILPLLGIYGHCPLTSQFIGSHPHQPGRYGSQVWFTGVLMVRGARSMLYAIEI